MTMKKHLLLLPIVLIMLSSSLFAQNSNLIIFSDSGEEFTMFLNGVQQNQKPAANVKASSLNADFYKVRIQFNNKSIPTMDKSVWFETKGMEYSFSITQKKNGKYVLRPVSQVAIQDQPSNTGFNESNYEEPEAHSTAIHAEPTGERPSPEKAGISMNVSANSMDVSASDGEENVEVSVEFEIDESTNTETTTTTTTSGTPEGLHVNMDIQEDEMDENIQINMSIQAEGSGSGTYTSTTTTTTSTTSTTTSSSSNSAGSNEYYEELAIENDDTQYSNGNCTFPMGSADFEDALSSINNKTFDDDKVTVAKQIARSKCLTSEQIRDIMKAIDYEDSRLDFAKYAYDFAYDPDNYYKVNDGFEFEMTIEELDEYLQNK